MICFLLTPEEFVWNKPVFIWPILYQKDVILTQIEKNVWLVKFINL
jgi:hypothetical protein